MIKKILITGSQRSGTTLMGLILDSHPSILNIDEDRFRKVNLDQVLNRNKSLKAISIKLPPKSADINFIMNDLSVSKLIWMVRDPRGVVASMVTLPVKFEGVNMFWVDRFAEVEINRMMHLYPQELLESLGNDLDIYLGINSIPYYQRSFEQKCILGAICWKMKQQAVDLYTLNKISFCIIRFEDLVNDAEITLRKLLEYLEIEWSPDLLRHHELHSGISIGLTMNDKKIDPGVANKYLEVLDNRVLDEIIKICGQTAVRFGYDLQRIVS